MLDKAIAAKGGLDKLRAVKTIVVKQMLTSPDSQGVNRIETTAYIQYPDKFRTETAAPGGGVNVQGFDGSAVWAKDARGTHQLPEAVARDARTTLRRDPIALLIAAADGAVTPRVLPDVKDAKGTLRHALELTAPDLSPIVLLIDPQTSRIDKMTFVADAPGRPIVEDVFSDYRAVEGVQIAFEASRRNGEQAVSRHVVDIKLNSPIDPALFKRPA
jgi:hypothetical protein